MRYGIGETLELGSKLEGEAQVEFMRKNFTKALGQMLEYALEPEWQWDLPPGTPPYKENPYLDQESNLYNDTRRMYIFMKGQGDHVSPLKKEVNFVQMLENVSKQDAILLVHAKEKSLPYGWTAERIREVFPGLISLDTKEGAAPDITAMSAEALGAPQEVIPDVVAIPAMSDDDLAALTLAKDTPVIVVESDETPEEEAARIAAFMNGELGGDAPETPLEPEPVTEKPVTKPTTKKSGTVAKKPVKKPVAKKAKAG
jgi:hypothetical protein